MEEFTQATGVSSPIDRLLAGLSDKHGAARLASREQLVAVGEPAVPALVSLLSAGDNQERWEAAKALSEIHSSAAAPGMVAALEDREFGVRWLAAEGLSATGTPALPPLLEALCERPESLRLREGAHHVIKAIHDPQASFHIRPVLAALEGVEPELTVGPAAQAALAGWQGA